MTAMTKGRASALVWLSNQFRRDLQFSNIFIVEASATAAYLATTALLAARNAPVPQGLCVLIAACLAYAALFCAKVALVIYLERQGGDARQFCASDRLVTTGAYALSRNPVYVLSLAQSAAWSLGLLGLGLGEWINAIVAGLAAMSLLYAHYWGMDRLIVPHEEAALRGKHPEAFATYCAHVNRWFGRR